MTRIPATCWALMAAGLILSTAVGIGKVEVYMSDSILASDQGMMDAGKVFLTEYRLPDGLFAGRIVADSWEQAERIAGIRRKGEKVIGQLAEVIPADDDDLHAGEEWKQR